MNTSANKNRYWHAKFESGEEIIADYFAEEDSLETWYLSGPDADWQPATSTTGYGAVYNLNVVRTWAPHFEGFTHNTVLTYNPALDEMKVQLWMRTKGKSGIVKAEDKSIYAQIEPNDTNTMNKICFDLRLIAHPFTGPELSDDARKTILDAAEEIERLNNIIDQFEKATT